MKNTVKEIIYERYKDLANADMLSLEDSNTSTKNLVEFYIEYLPIIEQTDMKIEVDLDEGFTEKQVLFFKKRAEGLSLRRSLFLSGINYSEYKDYMRDEIFKKKAQEIEELNVEMFEDAIKERMLYKDNSGVIMEYLRATKPDKWSARERAEMLKFKALEGDDVDLDDVLARYYGDKQEETNDELDG